MSTLDEGNFTRGVSFHSFFSFYLRDRVYWRNQLQVKRMYAFAGKRSAPCTFPTLSYWDLCILHNQHCNYWRYIWIVMLHLNIVRFARSKTCLNCIVCLSIVIANISCSQFLHSLFAYLLGYNNKTKLSVTLHQADFSPLSAAGYVFNRVITK